MNVIEKIQRYIENTGVKYPNGNPYQMRLSEMFALSHLASDFALDAVCLAFEYGRAKGERCAKARAKKEAAEV